MRHNTIECFVDQRRSLVLPTHNLGAPAEVDFGAGRGYLAAAVRVTQRTCNLGGIYIGNYVHNLFELCHSIQKVGGDHA